MSAVDEELRELVRHSLRARGVSRASFEVEQDGRRELIVLSAEEDVPLRSVASDGRDDSAHLRAILELLAKAAPAPTATTAAQRRSMVPAPPASSSVADAIDELLTAIVRAGIREGREATPVTEAIEQLLRQAQSPTPLGLNRGIGRLRVALGNGDVVGAARVLDGFSRLAHALREQGEGPRVAAWLGTGARRGGSTLYDRELVEVGREWLPGATRAALQRRYLVCTSTGEVFREERARNAQASVGGSARVILAGLSEVEKGPTPRRLRLLQYEVTPGLLQSKLERIGELAGSNIEREMANYKTALRAYPALCEPFVVLRLRLHAGGTVLRDDADRVLPLVGPRAVLSRLSAGSQTATLSWVAGRLGESDGALVLEPFGAAFRSGPTLRFERLR